MPKSYSTSDLIARYGRTTSFGVIDTIGVPHYYTIGPKHIGWANDHHSGLLGESARRAIPCARPDCTLTFDQHKTALLVECLTEPVDEFKAELQTYLQSIVPLCEEDGFAGFTLLDRFSKVA